MGVCVHQAHVRVLRCVRSILSVLLGGKIYYSQRRWMISGWVKWYQPVLTYGFIG